MKFKEYYNRILLRQLDDGRCQVLHRDGHWVTNEKMQDKWSVNILDNCDDGNKTTKAEAIEFVSKKLGMTRAESVALLNKK